MPGQDSLGLQLALTHLAPKLVDGATTIAGLRPLSGGAIQEIWRFDVVMPDAAIPLILRRAPPANASSNASIDMPTEAHLMRHAATYGVPVPPIRHVLSPEDQLGTGFIMDFVAGETLGGRIVKHPRLAAARLHLARQCGEILARLHAAELPPAVQPQTPAELVSQWRDAYAACRWPRPVFEAAFTHLARRCPPPSPRPSLVHGDFRNGNLIVGEDGIRAVLDWELAHAGDPLEDLGWLCVNSWRFGHTEKIVGGFGDLDDLIDGYQRAGGGPVDRAALAWWQEFGTLRWGVMCAGMVASFRGADPSVERAVICRRASETEIDLLNLLAA
jgi:aminoglycoside phosphotransferase (APT) family kinase protein